jgi:hypothetical protein
LAHSSRVVLRRKLILLVKLLVHPVLLVENSEIMALIDHALPDQETIHFLLPCVSVGTP